MSKKTTYPCPQCQKDVEWNSDNAFRPFCSDRCRLIDLGAWANEEYQVSGPDNETESGLDPEAQEWHHPPLH